jgi:hypothetical protein
MLRPPAAGVQARESETRLKLEHASYDKTLSLLTTSKLQKMARRVEELDAGRYQLSHRGEYDGIAAELTRLESKRDTIHAVLENLLQIEPRLEGPLQKALLLLAV